MADRDGRWGWEKNKGYGTAAHRAALEIHGPSVHHRAQLQVVACATIKAGIRTNISLKCAFGEAVLLSLAAWADEGRLRNEW